MVKFLLLVFLSIGFLNAEDCLNLNEYLEQNPSGDILMDSFKIHFLYFNIGKTITLIGWGLTFLTYLLMIHIKNKELGSILFIGIILSALIGFIIGFSGYNPVYGKQDPIEQFYKKYEKKIGKNICRGYDFF